MHKQICGKVGNQLWVIKLSEPHTLWIVWILLRLLRVKIDDKEMGGKNSEWSGSRQGKQTNLGMNLLATRRTASKEAIQSQITHFSKEKDHRREKLN